MSHAARRSRTWARVARTTAFSWATVEAPRPCSAVRASAAGGVEARQALAEQRPREQHVALLVAGHQPQYLAHRLVPAVLEVAEAQVEIELVVEAAERGHHRLDRQVGIQGHLGEGLVARPRDGLG